ncbi:alpha-1,4-glucan--maltose-1-phosphate maltosyltransferase [Agrococcus sp. HG114]|uniref:alpha-1,4-glucan--maltose-1-phosphate maltosyltransferase n=1 Tax=Agrococcus sp. HG114 TaxID=2969757 RepID=UPI00215A2195|nr:alpha-1,4-glucan--maltose-1-phosphate maltosyltransferase [Agrococcus sp. HG114]MCR8670904.1 alpha-1,4-glucan--maltose-1-phosphate maltosyltransferase [Agrococcus sp. HG114]
MAKQSEVLSGRIPVLDLYPQQPGGRFPAKAVVGDVIPFRAVAFREGHDRIGVTLVLRSPAGIERRVPMEPLHDGFDRWLARAQVDEQGMWRWHVEAWADEWATWHHNAEIKIPAGMDVELMAVMGSQLLARAARAATGPDATLLAGAATALKDSRAPILQRWASVNDPDVLGALDRHRPRSLVTASDPVALRVERTRAAVGAWYELFPRSEGAERLPDGSWRSGTFATAAERLPAVKAMGFDVVYLPPVHPIGEVNRKGRNNTLTPQPGDPGSPWAIGSRHGGHDAIHPDLGTIDDFRDFVARAADAGLEVAMDLALQAAPDHPWVAEHPEWFTTLPDGSIAFAENPPKKYQDIYPVNFDNDPEGIVAEVRRILEQWIACGVRIFRVDNPHTKPLWFWERLIGEVNAQHGDIVFLAEAFTRPAVMQALAQVGFQQSYTYFAWRNTKAELEEYLQEVTGDQAAWFKPAFWVNTPDILTEYLQFGGVPAFKVRAAIAATAVPTWGMYAGYELIEDVARPGAEEAIDNEKYEYRPRDWEQAERNGTSIAPYIARLNEIRAAHPAIRQLWALDVHWSDDDAVLVYSKHVEGRFTESGEDDTIVVVANVDPHSARQTTVHLDLTKLGLRPGERFEAHDLISGETWTWSDHNFVRLDAFVEPAHIIHVRRSEA